MRFWIKLSKTDVLLNEIIFIKQFLSTISKTFLELISGLHFKTIFKKNTIVCIFNSVSFKLFLIYFVVKEFRPFETQSRRSCIIQNNIEHQRLHIFQTTLVVPCSTMVLRKECGTGCELPALAFAKKKLVYISYIHLK